MPASQVQSDLDPLEKLVLAIEGQMALSVMGKGERRVYQIWRFQDDKDFHFTGRTLSEAIALALPSVVRRISRRRFSGLRILRKNAGSALVC